MSQRYHLSLTHSQTPDAYSSKWTTASQAYSTRTLTYTQAQATFYAHRSWSSWNYAPHMRSSAYYPPSFCHLHNPSNRYIPPFVSWPSPPTYQCWQANIPAESSRFSFDSQVANQGRTKLSSLILPNRLFGPVGHVLALGFAWSLRSWLGREVGWAGGRAWILLALRL